MRTFLALGAIITLLLFGAFFALVLEVLPYLFLGLVIGAIIRTRRGPRPTPDHRAPKPSHRRPVPLPPPLLTTGGWAYIPVWVEPAPQRTMRVIDAEVVRSPRDE